MEVKDEFFKRHRVVRTLNPKKKTEITAIRCFNEKGTDYVAIGTKNGYLYKYRFPEVMSKDGMECLAIQAKQLVEKDLKHGSRAVKLIDYIKALNCMIVLCGKDRIQFLQASTFEPLKSILSFNPKSVDYFCMYTPPNANIKKIRLAVASRKKLHLYEFDKGQKKFMLKKDLILPVAAVQMRWIGTNLIMGYNKKPYDFINTMNGKPTSTYIKVGKVPLIGQINQTTVLTSGDPNVCVFVDVALGRLAQMSTIHFKFHPISFARCNEYLAALLSNGAVHVISILDQKPVQTVIVEKAILTDSTSDRFYVATSKVLTCFRMVTERQQVSQMINQLRIVEARKLLSKIQPPPTHKDFRNFEFDSGWALFSRLFFKSAMVHFRTAGLDPRELIILYPHLCLKEMKYKSQIDSAPRQTIDKIIEIGINLKQLQPVEREAKSIKLTSNQYHRESEYWLADFLWKLRQKPFRNPDLVVNGRRKGFQDESVQQAVDTCLLFLSIGYNKDYEKQRQLEITESALRKQFGGKQTEHFVIKPLPYSVQDLLRPYNSCHLTETAEFLTIAGEYNALSLFYQSVNEHEKALDIWRKLGTGEYKDTSHDGIEETVNYLTKLTARDAHLWTYSAWVLQANPKKGMEIFTDPRKLRHPESQIPPESVLSHLEEASAKAKQAAGDEKVFPYLQVYLEYLINDTGAEIPDLHDKLAEIYLDTILQYWLDSSGWKKVPVGQKPSPFFADKEKEEKETVYIDARVLPGSDADPVIAQYRRVFYQFLCDSCFYDVERMIQLLSKTTLYEEIVVVYTKKKSYRDGLHVLYRDMKDFYGACDYCVSVNSVFTLLLSHEEKIALVEHHERIMKNMKKESGSPAYGFEEQKNHPAIVLHQDNIRPYDHLSSSRYHYFEQFESITEKNLCAEPNKLRSDRFLMFLDILLLHTEQEQISKYDHTVRSLKLKHDEITEEQKKEIYQLIEPTSDDFGNVLDIIENYADQIDPASVLKLLPKQTPVKLVYIYLEKIFPVMQHRVNDSKILTNIARTNANQTEFKLRTLQKQRIVIDEETRCVHCQRTVGQSYFKVHPTTHSLLHFHCYEYYLQAHPTVLEEKTSSNEFSDVIKSGKADFEKSGDPHIDYQFGDITKGLIKGVGKGLGATVGALGTVGSTLGSGVTGVGKFVGSGITGGLGLLGLHSENPKAKGAK